MTPRPRRSAALVAFAALPACLVGACGGAGSAASSVAASTTVSTASSTSASPTSASTSSASSIPASSAATSASSASTPSGAATSASIAASASTAAASGATVTGAQLAATMRAACTGMYTVRTTMTGESPRTLTGRGFLGAKTLAARLEGDADTRQDVELVGGRAYTSLGGVTTGPQRIVVDLADDSDQLGEGVRSIIGPTDLDPVLAAVASATTVSQTGREVTAVIPARSVVRLFGWGLDGSVPSTTPLHLTLDAANRPVRVAVTLGTSARSSTYGGWGAGPAIVAPPPSAIVDSPL